MGTEISVGFTTEVSEEVYFICLCTPDWILLRQQVCCVSMSKPRCETRVAISEK